jgi:predicted RNA-binding protein with PUA-like domain
LPRPVTLEAVKADAKLAKMALVTAMRLSVQPVTKAEWEHVCALGGLVAADLAPSFAKPKAKRRA